MLKLSSPRTIKYIMEKYGFKFSKSLGQNFLINEQVIEDIMEGAEVGPNDCILEVGPGIGVMTQAMAERAKKVVSVEIDSSLLPVLDETLDPHDNVVIVNEDILKVDVRALIDREFDGEKPKVVANLPYYVTTPIIMMFLEEGLPVTDIVVMVQKEVADRIVSGPGNKIYGALSVAVQFYADPHVIVKAPKGLFMPQPKVDSVVVRMKILDQPKVDVKDRKLFFRVVKAAFGMRRKTLLNALSSGLNVSKDLVNEVMESCAIDPKRRGETLSIEEFGQLADAFESRI
jgi:16S rRNA (adenine1518-N6/adenine1519-N6)-dimethyltransferase